MQGANVFPSETMVLATQCPFCQTTFRVAPDQLALREGLVRCGNCKEVFDGKAHLIAPEPDEQIAPTPAANTAASTTPPDWITGQLANTFASVAAATNDAPWGAPAENHRAALSITASPEPSPPDTHVIAQPITDVNVLGAPEIHPTPEQPDTPNKASGTLGLRQETTFGHHHADDDVAASLTQNRPAPTHASHAQDDVADQGQPEEPDDAADDNELPAFVQRAERRERLQRITRVVMAAASALLAITLVFQLLYLGRNQLVSWLPATYRPLSTMCVALHCTIGLPSNIEQLSLESSELQLLPPSQNIYTLNVLLHNHSHATQTWPYLELTLNDGDDKAIIRRVFTPSEYLPATLQLGDGFAGESEQAIKLTFELAQPAASDYRVYLFFP